MGKPAARLLDPHVCPMSDGPKPHVGGPLLPPFQITVLTGNQPQARIGDMATCVGPPDIIALGSAGVIVCGKPAARMGDLTAHGGNIVAGLPTVLIGETAGGGGSGGAPLAGAGGMGEAMMMAAMTAASAYIAPNQQARTLKTAHQNAAPFVEICTA